MFFRPATPGFLVTLIATILLAVVCFNVPVFKSIFFLKASLKVGNESGEITLGTLGYCITLNNGTTCTKPSVGYEFDPNKLLGNNITFAQIPSVVVKWITYALFLHVIALAGSAISAVFGLLAHVREMSMSCFSTCISGFAAVVTLVAFIFDIVLFFLAKARINKVPGGQAVIGNAIWLTLAAWLLLFFSGCFYAFGRCCITNRPRAPREKKNQKLWGGRENPEHDAYAERMRMDAIKSEQDRKARQQRGEIGLPALPEHKPLTSPQDDDEPYRDTQPLNVAAAGMAGAGAGGPNPRRQASQPSGFRGGYVQGAPGTRAVDEYNQPSQGYPPQPQPQRQQTMSPPHRQYSSSAGSPPPSTHTRSGYASSAYSGPVPITQSPPPMPASNQYLAAGIPAGHAQYPSGREYGHTAGGTTYHSAASHQQYPSNSSSQFYNPYAQQPPAQPQGPLNPDTYNTTGAIGGFVSPYNKSPSPRAPSHSPPPAQPSAYYTQQQQLQPQQEQLGQPGRSYTLGGTGYAQSRDSRYSDDAAYGGYDDTYNAAYSAAAAAVANAPQRQPSSGGYLGPAADYGHDQDRLPTPGPLQTSPPQSPGAGGVTGPRGPREMKYSSDDHHDYEDSPPGYDAGPSQPAGAWAEKR